MNKGVNMSNKSVHFSSDKQTWETPQDFFDKVNDIFNFTLDACAEDATAKVSNYFTVEDDALTKDWKGVVWCNPPYGREQVKFVEKAYIESVKNNSIVVMLIPSRPETTAWQNLIFKEASHICFIKGRLKFGGSKDNAPFPSALVVFGDVDCDLSFLGKVFRK